MIASLVVLKAVASVLVAPQEGVPSNAGILVQMTAQDNPKQALEIYHYWQPLDSVWTSPYKEWKFSHISVAMAQPLRAPGPTQRFRIFAQGRESEGNDELGLATAKYMLRLWNYVYFRCDVDHSPRFGRLVDVYLCKEGDPGGEHFQMYNSFDLDEQDRPKPTNFINIYQAFAAKRGITLSRELAHEYGHAILPSAGGFEGPESYANGELGERVFLGWMRDDMRAGKINTSDTMGTTQAELDAYYKRDVEPRVKQVGLKGPNFELLKGRTEKSFWEYVSIATYLSRIAPTLMYGRFTNLSTIVAEDAQAAIKSAAEERTEWEVVVPAELSGQAIWIPLVKGNVSGAKVVSRKGDWAKIQTKSGQKVMVKNPPLPLE
jgi:hypothetical protein